MAALPPPPASLPPPVPPFLTRLLLAHPPPPSHHAYSPTPTQHHHSIHPHTISNSSSTNSFSPNTSPLLQGTRSPPLGSSSGTTYGPQPQMPPQPLYLPPPVMEDEVPELNGPDNFSMVSRNKARDGASSSPLRRELTSASLARSVFGARRSALAYIEAHSPRRNILDSSRS